MVQGVFNEGCQALAAGRFLEAASFFREVLSRDELLPDAWNNLGISLFQAGQRQEAVGCFQRAVALAPNFAQAHNNLGHSLAQCGALEEGLQACRKALALDPNAEAYNNTGLALQALDRHAEALECFERACELAPDFLLPWTNRAVTLKELGKPGAAAAGFRKVLELDPNHAPALVGLSGLQLDCGEVEKALTLLRKALALAPESVDARSNLIMALNYSHRATQQEISDESALWGALHDGLGAAVPGREILGRRVRIGFVSGDLHRHPVGTFLKDVLKHIDHTSFEITCYQNSTRSDQVTAELRRYAERWFVIVGMTDGEAAELVRSNGIDILVDLSGHTGANRLALFGHRPAPIQATWLGYWHSTGLSSIDYLITDPVTTPPGDEPFYTERLLRLPRCRFCYAPPAPSPYVDDLAALSNGFVTFGSFNNIAKITPEVVALWSRVLLAVPNSRLVLKWKSFRRAALRKRFRARFASHGVDPDRIECRPGSNHFLALAEYNDIDIALDPFPFNGGMTTCEALWMGAPVVTLTGEAAVGRQSAAFLQALGLPELICRGEDEYVAKAAELAADLPRLARLKEGLRERMERSPLCDGAGFARDLEDAFRTMAREHAAGLPDLPAPQAPRAALDAAPLPPVQVPFEPAPRQRLRVAYLAPASAWEGEGAALLAAAAQHDREELETFLYLDGAWLTPQAAAALPGAKRRQVARLRDDLVVRLLALDRIDVLVDLTPQAAAPRELADAAVPVRLALADLVSPESSSEDAAASPRLALALEARYRERWLRWFVNQKKPSRGGAKAKAAEALVGEGRSLWQAGRLEEAEVKLTQGLALDPRNADALTNLGAALVYQWRLADGLACFRRALALDPRHVKARSSLLFAMNYSDRVSDAEIHADSVAWDRAQRLPAGARPRPVRNRDPERPLRIGYLSPDFRRHSVNFFFEPLLSHHGRESFRIFCYSCVERPDEATARLRSLAAQWRDCAHLEDGEIAELVRRDEIDVLVDLAGHSGARIRLPVLALKPAPVQVSWLGFPNTTGLKGIDYRLTDAWADPEGEGERWYSEKLVRLPEGFLCYLPDPDAPEPGVPPHEKNGYVTFGSFNMLPKLSPSTVALWSRLMHEVPDARLMLKCHPLGDPGTRDRMLRAFRRHGIDPERIALSGVVPAQEHLAMYREVDLALDPFPYNGTTTTCEALWMGVPVVTLSGARHASRVGNSILRRLSLDELVAGDAPRYLEIAGSLARDPQRLAAYRSELRGRMAASPLCDGKLFAGQVEAAYRDMWRAWCRRKSYENLPIRR